ncbi:hypothetical protein CgunFtcFv8_021336 [Champsocephalus gunnari]|uniref:Uncharacterized protein n=1 Tax=Champsocephalus gunnari TaxID=52237 RepID=A0AAN8ECG9_CHAGU|nr:hypothetical protein CgunFtcFv8_021336 [Champsocephalus gunnari]
MWSRRGGGVRGGREGEFRVNPDTVSTWKAAARGWTARGQPMFSPCSARAPPPAVLAPDSWLHLNNLKLSFSNRLHIPPQKGSGTENQSCPMLEAGR